MIRKPVVRQFVMNMVGKEERDQHVDVEQGHARARHEVYSSRSALTAAIVSGAEPARRTISGTPLRTPCGFRRGECLPDQLRDDLSR